ncbi:hypothetical protein ATO12_09105 [Aquimarina atlantica]|uniref:HTH araC/xylS-type domain-containing protein n=1 Tax=Aquimarina atlantica TaxID=1317122 RepID=A0A023BXS1_9FLAO|nr:helix-turn-helix domain-containing protein [Aquimarina atlantica]EZH74887.1 hypothetical protein ATO12_09105 [Aquimarina atlantica]
MVLSIISILLVDEPKPIMRTTYLALFIFLFSFFGYGQKFQIPDSLKDKTINELENLSYEYYPDTLKYKIYSNTLLAKAKELKDSLGLAKGYQLVSYYRGEDFPTTLAYLDSSIAVSKNLNHKRFPAISYSVKGVTYREMGDDYKALECFLAAAKYSKKTNNISFYYLTKHNIASIKEEIGEVREAISIYKKVLQYEDDNNIKTQGHLTTILRLADSYRKISLFDSATYYNRKGFLLAYEKKDEILDFFTFNEGVNLFHKKNYQASLDSINKSIPVIEKYRPLIGEELFIDAYTHLAKLYKKFDNKEKHLEYLLKIDQSYKRSNYAFVEMREGHKMLIDYYKSKDDKNNQLYYINQLLEIDSILDERYKSINKKITKEFDIPNLLNEKEEIIASLEAEKSSSATQILVISSLLILSLGGVGYYYYNQRRYKKRFLQLLDTNTPQKTTPAPKDKTGITTISPDTLEQLLAHLEEFEKKQKYLASNINSKDLAKSFGSNSSYLSLVVNTYKQKTLSQYINDLRIDFVVEKLQSDSKFRKYTIKAIAQEVGFNTAEAFSKTFYKKTGIYPSYFIKKLEE